VLFVSGLNDTDEELAAIRAAVERIGPDSIDVNTVARPPAEDVQPVPPERLAKIASFFGPKARPVVTSKKAHQAVPGEAAAKILDLLRRRPCSFAEICSSLGLETSQAAAALAALSRKGFVASVDGRSDGFYRAK
jgi:wyosine [tRNA(Phe)-imidazoG37] synthetase (radical SAM superfamily)